MRAIVIVPQMQANAPGADVRWGQSRRCEPFHGHLIGAAMFMFSVIVALTIRCANDYSATADSPSHQNVWGEYPEACGRLHVG